MGVVATFILGLLTQLPTFAAQIYALFNQVRPALSANDLATLNAVWAVLAPHIQSDVLAFDAAAHAELMKLGLGDTQAAPAHA